MLRLSQQDKELIEELRERIAGILVDECEYRNSNAFLVNWLHHKHSNVPVVESAFRKHTKWRRDHRIEELPKEIVADDLEQLLPYELHGIDKEGRPIVWVQFGRWDLHSLTKKSREAQFERYGYQFCERIERSIIEQQQMVQDGINADDEIVWQFTGVFDMEGFSFRHVLSPRVIKMMTTLAAAAEANWPLRCGVIICINAPALVKTLIAILKPFLSKNTKNAIRIYANREEWEHELQKVIGPSLIPVQLGGSRNTELYKNKIQKYSE